MFKRISILAIFIILVCSSTGLCSAPKPTKRIALFYKVSDAILMCQNSNEDMEKGKIEFEKELNTHYSKRFIVDSVKYLPNKPFLSAEEYLNMVKPNEVPFILQMDINGTGSAIQTFQNGFGARKSIVVPSVKIKRNEYIVSREDKTLYGVSFGEVEYYPQAMALGGSLYSDNDPRKNTKNGVRGYIRDYCTYVGDKINKYADLQKYNTYNDMYTGDFKKALAEEILKQSNTPYFGIDSTDDLVINLVGDGMPMDIAGARVGDTIEAVDDVQVSNKEEFIKAIERYRPGSNVKIKIKRAGQEIILNVIPISKLKSCRV